MAKVPNNLYATRPPGAGGDCGTASPRDNCMGVRRCAAPPGFFFFMNPNINFVQSVLKSNRFDVRTLFLPDEQHPCIAPLGSESFFSFSAPQSKNQSNITLDTRLPFPDSVGGICPGPATTQKVYHGIEWFSQLAGWQFWWLTVLSICLQG